MLFVQMVSKRCFLFHPKKLFYKEQGNFSYCTYSPFAFPGGKQGPLIGVRGFHPSAVRWCAMHVIHLGLLYVANGSAMLLVPYLAVAYF